MNLQERLSDAVDIALDCTVRNEFVIIPLLSVIVGGSFVGPAVLNKYAVNQQEQHFWNGVKSIPSDVKSRYDSDGNGYLNRAEAAYMLHDLK